MRIVPFCSEHFIGVETLWRECFPDDPARNHAAAAIPAKLAMGDDLFLVVEGSENEVIGTIMAWYDGHRGWLYSVAVKPDHRRNGTGTRLVEAACDRLKAFGCVKVNLQIRAGNEAVTAFYEALGFSVEPRTSMGREL